jgi:hypothetical protein
MGWDGGICRHIGSEDISKASSYFLKTESRQENKARKEILNFQVQEKGNYYKEKASSFKINKSSIYITTRDGKLPDKS